MGSLLGPAPQAGAILVFACWKHRARETCCLAGFLFGRVFKGVLQGVPALASTLLSQAPTPKGAC